MKTLFTIVARALKQKNKCFRIRQMQSKTHFESLQALKISVKLNRKDYNWIL